MIKTTTKIKALLKSFFLRKMVIVVSDYEIVTYYNGRLIEHSYIYPFMCAIN